METKLVKTRWSALAVSAAISAPAMGQLVDPEGDAVDSFGAGPPLLDIDTISVSFDDATLYFSMTFHTPISAPSMGQPDGVVGFLEFDTDQNAGTGIPPIQNTFSPPFVPLVAGVDYLVFLFTEALHPGLVEIIDAGGSLVATVPIKYGPASLTASVPLAALGGDDGVVDFTSIIGTVAQPTDATDEVGTSEPIAGAVLLDVKPGVCPNPFHPTGNPAATLDAAVLGTDLFDPSQIDASTVVISRADGVGGSVRALSGELVDAATPFPGALCDCHDLGGDGVADLVLSFQRTQMQDVLELDGETPGTELELEVSGQLVGGEAFTASDCVVYDPAAAADVNGDGVIDIVDLLALLADWGACPPAEKCPCDINTDGLVGIEDLLLLLAEM